MTLPSVRVEIAFGFGPLDEPADGDFIDIASATVKVTDVTIGRGRPSEFDAFPPGVAQVKVMDLNRVLDPSNTASIYNGQLLPRVPIRIRGRIGATYYPRFRGFVDGWPMQLGVSHTEVTIVVSDAIKLFAGIHLTESAFDDDVLDDSPNAYWRLGEEGELAVDSSAGRYDGRYSSGVARAAVIVPYGNNGSAEFEGTSQESVVVTDTGARVDSLPISVEMWIQFIDEPVSRNNQAIFLQPAYSTNEGFGIFTDTDNVTGVVISYADSGADAGYSTFAGFNVDLYDGQSHHLAVVINTSRRDFYFDGNKVAQAFNSTAAAGALGVSPIYIGAYLGFYAAPEGKISNVALYDTALSDATVLAHYQAGAYPYQDGSSGARINQVLDLIDWPASLRSVDAGEMLLAPASFNGRNALDYLRAIAASEQGRLFISRDGKVVFHQRDRFITQATESTSQFNFSDDGAGDAGFGSLSYAYDDRFIYNEAKVQREGGNTQTATDAASAATYGPLGRSLTGLLLDSDGSARALAEYIVYRYSVPQVRAESWSLHPEANASSWPDVFDLEIGHRVTLESTPARKGSQIVVDLHIEQITESVKATANDWQFTFAGSPVDPNAANYFTWGGNGATQGWGTGLWR